MSLYTLLAAVLVFEGGFYLGRWSNRSRVGAVQIHDHYLANDAKFVAGVAALIQQAYREEERHGA